MMKDILGREQQHSSSQYVVYAIFYPCYVWVSLSKHSRVWLINTVRHVATGTYISSLTSVYFVFLL